MKKTILIAGYYGFSNSGDDAVLASVCRDISKKGKRYQARILSNMPEKTMRDYNVPAVNRKNMLKVIREIKNAEVLLLGGGSLLQDVTSSRSLYYYLGHIVIAKIFKTKTILYANGIGPLNKKFNRYLVEKVINRVDIITLREQLSEVELKRLKVTKPEIHVTSDPVFNLEVMDVNIDKVLRDEGIDVSRPIVALFFRSWGTHKKYIEKVAKLSDYIVKKYDMTILFVPMKHPSDLVVSKSIQEKMVSSSYILKNKYDSDTLIQLIGSTKFVISMRLHALLYAAIKDIPMIGFVYDPKVKYYLEELDMYSVEDINTFNAQDIEGFIDEIIGNYDEIKEHINKVAIKQKIKAKKNIEYLIDLVER